MKRFTRIAAVMAATFVVHDAFAQLPDQPDPASPGAAKFLPVWPASQNEWFPASGKEHPGIATGPGEGAAMRLGEDIAALCGQTGIPAQPDKASESGRFPAFRLNVLATDGPLDSVWRLLSDDEVQLAITHYDVWHCAEHLVTAYKDQNKPERASAWQRILDDTRLIMPLYGAPIHVLVNRDHARKHGITDLLDLASGPHRVAVGPPNSGSAITSYLIDQTLAVESPTQWRMVKMDERLALKKVEQGNLDAVILIGATPHPVLASASNWAGSIDLLKFGRAGRFFKDTEYPVRQLTNEDYPSLSPNDGIDTRQVPVVLVTHAGYSGTGRKGLWIKHIVYRLLSRVGTMQTGELPDGIAWLRGAGLWPSVSPAGLNDIHWARYPDTRAWVDAWQTSYVPPRLIEPTDAWEQSQEHLTPTLPMLPLSGKPASK